MTIGAHALTYRRKPIQRRLALKERKLGTEPPVERVIAKINAPITARLENSCGSSRGLVWKITVVGTRKSSNNDAPRIVLLPKTKSAEPAIKTTMAPIKSALASGSGIPLDAMNEAVPEKLPIFPGNAFTNSAAIQMRPKRSRALEKLMERFKRNGVGAEGLVADPNPTCHW